MQFRSNDSGMVYLLTYKLIQHSVVRIDHTVVYGTIVDKWHSAPEGVSWLSSTIPSYNKVWSNVTS